MADTLTENLNRLTSPHLGRRVRETAVEHVELVDRGVRLGGMSLCSALNPEREAERWMAGIDIGRAKYLVVFGLALGHHLEALRRRTDLPRLVLEPSLEVIRAALSCRPLELERVRVVNTPVELRDHLAAILSRGDAVVTHAWPPTRRLFDKVFAAASDAIEEAGTMATVSNDTLEQRLRVWVRHFLANLPRCVGRLPARGLSGWLRGRPAVLVSAGPSLDRNVELLSGAGDRALVVGVNTAMGALEQAGVRADFVAALEVLDVSCQLRELSLNGDVPRLLCTWANPALFALPGDTLPFPAANPYFERISGEVGLGGGVDMGGSVANAAFNLLRIMEADPVILVGQDLAYTDSRAYARGTVFEELEVSIDAEKARLGNLEVKRRIGASVPGADTTREETRVEQVPAWGGGAAVATTMEFNYFRYMFETYARHMPDTRRINATEGGAHIKGFEELPLAEALAQLPTSARPTMPAGPVIAGSGVRAALTAELSATRQVLDLAHQGRGQGVAALDRLAAAIKQGGLVEAYCWPSLQAIIADPDAGADDLCRRVADDAAETAQLLENALQELP